MELDMSQAALAIEAAKARWMRRDRIVAVLAADYTDLALGLGETTLWLSAFACSSASVANAHSKAASMGHAAGSLRVEGACGEDFERLLGMVGMAWSRPSGWGYRYLDISALSAPESGAEVGIYYARGDLRRGAHDLGPAAQGLRRLMAMYGVESSEPSPTVAIREESSKLANPGRNPMFWQWLEQAAKA